jgi:acyl-CoA thioester hydrolase
MSGRELFSITASVRPEWIDYNGHMNMGFYLVAFDHLATDNYFRFLDLHTEHLAETNKSTFTLGSNIDYLREVFEGDPLRMTTQLVDYDHKRLHYYHTMYHEEHGFVAATNECLTLYVDMGNRRSTTFSDEHMARFEEQLQIGKQHGIPDGFGRRLGIRR